MRVRFWQPSEEENRERRLRDRYYPRITSLWPDAERFENAARVPRDAKAVQLKRVKTSHCGIAEVSCLEGLLAEATDQAFLEEICELDQLEFLNMAYPTTVKELVPLKKLRRLRFLRIDSPRNIDDFSALLEIESLEALIIENAKHLATLDWLAPLASQLKVLGIEGSMSTTQRIESLAPLASFDLEALFLASTRLADQDLTPLHGMKNLKLLQTAINAPRREFEALKEALPDCVCSWFDPANWKDFRGPPKPKARS